MTALQQVMLGFEGLRRALRHLGWGPLWAPWAALAGVQLLVLACLVQFAHPAVSWFMAPLLEGVAGEQALRYPNVFRLLPGLYGRAAVVLSIALGTLAAGAGVWMFARRLEGGRPRAAEGLRAALGRAFALVAAGLPAVVGSTLLLTGVEWWLSRHDAPRMVERAIRFAGLLGALSIQSAFALLSAAIVLDRMPLLQALGGLAGFVRRGFWGALTLSAVLFLPHLPAHELSRHASTLVQRGVPELVAAVVAADILLGAGTGLLLAGGVALVYLTAVSGRAGEAA